MFLLQLVAYITNTAYKILNAENMQNQKSEYRMERRTIIITEYRPLYRG